MAARISIDSGARQAVQVDPPVYVVVRYKGSMEEAFEHPAGATVPMETAVGGTQWPTERLASDLREGSQIAAERILILRIAGRPSEIAKRSNSHSSTACQSVAAPDRCEISTF
jgi:hypothetical protein